MPSFLSSFGLMFLLIISLSLPTQTFALSPHRLLEDDELVKTDSMTVEEIQAFLEQGGLKSFRGPDVNGVEKSAAEIIWDASQLFGLNPRFLLVLLQREQSLIRTPKPTQKQLDWALGYGVCDSCSLSDPRLAKFKGFGNQIHYAAKRIRESYINDLETTGKTLTGFGIGIPKRVGDQTIVPETKATAILYTYTPHLLGNLNFVRIWRRWFTPAYPHGSLLQNIVDGGVWLVDNGLKRPITTKAAFVSRFDASALIPVAPSVLSSYQNGAPIHFPNYTPLIGPDESLFVLVDDVLRPIVSEEDARKIGFAIDSFESVSEEDLALYTRGTPIVPEQGPITGRLLRDTNSGLTYYVLNGQRSPVLSEVWAKLRFPTLTVETATATELAQFTLTRPIGPPDGTLVGITGDPAIYLVSKGERRHIVSEEAFYSYGWKWGQVVWTELSGIGPTPLGEPLLPLGDELLEDGAAAITAAP